MRSERCPQHGAAREHLADDKKSKIIDSAVDNPQIPREAKVGQGWIDLLN